MKELISLLLHFDISGLFIKPTRNSMVQLFRYLFVGGVATIADWGVLYFCTSICGIYYLLSGVASFIAGLSVNFLLSRLMVFSAMQSRFNRLLEFAGYVVIGLLGLGFTLGIMAFLTGLFHLYYMASKVIATIVVLAWNYGARRLMLYKNIGKDKA